MGNTTDRGFVAHTQATISPPDFEAFRLIAASDDVDVFESMLVLARAIDPSVDVEECRAIIDALAWSLRWIDGEKSEIARVEAFVAGMRETGFRGDTDQYHDLRNTVLPHVLRRKTGIPISLSVVFMEVGKRLGLNLRGVGFPFHFLLKAVDSYDTFVDPFFGTTRDERSCAQLLREVSGSTIDFDRDFLRTVDGRQMFVRVLRNLKIGYKNLGAMNRAIEFCELILLFDPEQPTEYRDRGTISLALGEWSRAVDDLSTYLAMIPDADDRATVLGQLQWVLHQQASVH